MGRADYRKHNDHSHNSSTYHKKDGTPIRAILKREADEDLEAYFASEAGLTPKMEGDRPYSEYDAEAQRDLEAF